MEDPKTWWPWTQGLGRSSTKRLHEVRRGSSEEGTKLKEEATGGLKKARWERQVGFAEDEGKRAKREKDISLEEGT